MMNPLAVIIEQARHAVIDPSAPSAAAAARRRGAAADPARDHGRAVRDRRARSIGGLRRRSPSGSNRLGPRSPTPAVAPSRRRTELSIWSAAASQVMPRHESLGRARQLVAAVGCVEQRLEVVGDRHRSPMSASSITSSSAAKADTTLGWRRRRPAGRRPSSPSACASSSSARSRGRRWPRCRGRQRVGVQDAARTRAGRARGALSCHRTARPARPAAGGPARRAPAAPSRSRGAASTGARRRRPCRCARGTSRGR